MIHVGICDDKKKHREGISEAIRKILFAYDDMEFVFFASGEEVVQAIEREEFFCDVLFLDIHMDKIDGLETAAYIREHQVDVDIIFVTVSSEHVFDGYTYQAFSYLVKPVNEKRLRGELQRYMELREQSARCLHISVGGKQVKILLDRVKYFNSDGRKICAIQKGKDEEISFYAKMGDLTETLKEDGFLRCHQSYLVNERLIDSCSRTEIQIGDEVLPVSRKYIDEVKEWMKKRDGERG